MDDPPGASPGTNGSTSSTGRGCAGSAHPLWGGEVHLTAECMVSEGSRWLNQRAGTALEQESTIFTIGTGTEHP